MHECIPVGCVPAALYRKGGIPDRDSLPCGQTPVKTLPLQTTFMGGKYDRPHIVFSDLRWGYTFVVHWRKIVLHLAIYILNSS